MTITDIDQNSFSNAIALLKKSNLPTEDISDTTKLFAAIENNEVLGTIAVEFYGSIALLRSFAVAEETRSKGVGKQLVEFVEDFVKQKGITTLVLLTTTAAGYFSKKGFQTINRDSVPAEVKQSTEFKSTCPSSATVMKKELSSH